MIRLVKGLHSRTFYRQVERQKERERERERQRERTRERKTYKTRAMIARKQIWCASRSVKRRTRPPIILHTLAHVLIQTCITTHVYKRTMEEPWVNLRVGDIPQCEYIFFFSSCIQRCVRTRARPKKRLQIFSESGHSNNCHMHHKPNQLLFPLKENWNPISATGWSV